MVERSAGTGREHGSAVKHDSSVDDDGRHPLSILVRSFECGCIPHKCRIEHGDIRFHSRPDQATIGEAEALGRK